MCPESGEAIKLPNLTNSSRGSQEPSGFRGGAPRPEQRHRCKLNCTKCFAGIAGCRNCRFLYFSLPVAAQAFQAIDTQLGARHRRRTSTIHRGSAQLGQAGAPRTVKQGLCHSRVQRRPAPTSCVTLTLDSSWAASSLRPSSGMLAIWTNLKGPGTRPGCSRARRP